MNSKILRNSILAVALALVAVPAQAQFGSLTGSLRNTPASGSYKAEVDRYIQSQDMRGAMVKVLKANLSQMLGAKLSASKLDAMVNELVDAAMPVMAKTVEDCLRPSISLEELQQVNAFFATPTGRKMISLQPTLMAAGEKAMQQPEIQAKFQQIAQRYISQ